MTEIKAASPAKPPQSPTGPALAVVILDRFTYHVPMTNDPELRAFIDGEAWRQGDGQLAAGDVILLEMRSRGYVLKSVSVDAPGRVVVACIFERSGEIERVGQLTGIKDLAARLLAELAAWPKTGDQRPSQRACAALQKAINDYELQVKT